MAVRGCTIMIFVLLLVVPKTYGNQSCDPNPCYNGGVCTLFDNPRQLLLFGNPIICNCAQDYGDLRCNLQFSKDMTLEPSDKVIKVNVGENVEVSCSYRERVWVSGWIAFDTPTKKRIVAGTTQNTDHVTVTRLQSTTAKMQITELEESDYGLYKCKTAWHYKTFWIQPYDAPEAPRVRIESPVTEGPVVTISRGDIIWFKCLLTSPGIATNHVITWITPSNHHVTSRILTDRESVQVNHSPEETTLYLSDTAEAGRYFCRAQDPDTGLTGIAFVELQFSDEPFAHVSRHQTLIKSHMKEDNLIKCRVLKPFIRPSSIEFFHNGVKIESGGRYGITSDGLRIQHIRPADEGVYTCRFNDTLTGRIDQVDIQVDVTSGHKKRA